MQGAGFGFARLQALHGLGHGHLVHDDLAFGQRLFGDAVARLDQRGLVGTGGGVHAGCALEKPTDVDRVDRVIRALVNDLEHILGANDRGGDLDAACAPAVRQRHLARTERHLVTRNGHGLQDGAADHAFGALIQIREVHVGCGALRQCFAQVSHCWPFAGGVHGLSFRRGAAWLATCGSFRCARILRTNSSSD